MLNPKGILKVFSYIRKQIFWEKVDITSKYIEQVDNEIIKEKILTIFVHYNSKGIIDKSDVEYIRCLNDISDVLFITNAKITNDELDKIKRSVLTCTIRKNHGFDFGAWREIICERKSMIREYDKLILANNSVFSPAYNLKGIINKMNNTDEKSYDFWGITAFTENRIFRSSESKLLKVKKIHQHIQSYFLCFNKTAISDDFFDFWSDYLASDSFVETVKNGEVELTQYMESRGYTWGVLIKDTLLSNKVHVDGPDMTKNEPDILLGMGCPFIKKKSLNRITIKQIENIHKCLMNVNPFLDKIVLEEYNKSIPCRTYKFFNNIFGKRIKL